MTPELEAARRELDDEFEQFRKNLDKLRSGLDRLATAGPEDDIEQLLEDYEDSVKKARTGGLVGGGAKGHRKAREKYMEIRGLKR